MSVKPITLEELQELISSGEKFKLIDVRGREYYDRGHIKGAISIPIDQLYETAEERLVKDETIVVYCVDYECPASTTAAEILTNLGYKNLFDYKGGYLEYRHAKLPVERNISLQEQKNNPHKKVTLQAKNVTLVGRRIQTDTLGANFRAVNGNLEEVKLESFGKKIKLITSFVSLDTSVCDLQVKQFNKEAGKLAENIAIIGISKDLPFAQKRFCEVNNIKNVTILSDYKYSSFGINYGLLVKENNLLARSIIILDTNSMIRYIQIVDEITTQPDYDEALQSLAEIVKNPLQEKTSAPQKCVPCEEGTPSLEKDIIQQHLSQLSGWQLIDDKKIAKEFKFKDFVEAKYFLDLLAVIAEEQGHHPNFTLIYNKLKVTLTTHVAGGLTDNDFIMARIIDEL